MFSNHVAECLGNYVYRLIDPRNGETFYVGKGRGNRVFQHITAELKLDDDEDEISAKLTRIREIRRANLDILHVIHRHAIPDEAVFEVEAAVMDCFPGLTNIQGGVRSGENGPMHSSEIIDRFELPELSPKTGHKLILININRVGESDRNIYSQVRFAWRIDEAKAKTANYILAMERGVCIGVFVAEEWNQATPENFPEFAEVAAEAIAAAPEKPLRWGFKGQEAPQNIQQLYFRKRAARDDLKHYRYPIRYWGY